MSDSSSFWRFPRRILQETHSSPANINSNVDELSENLCPKQFTDNLIIADKSFISLQVQLSSSLLGVRSAGAEGGEGGEGGWED